MEILYLLLVLVFLGGPFLGIAAFLANRATRDQLERLEREVADLRAQLRARPWETFSKSQESAEPPVRAPIPPPMVIGAEAPAEAPADQGPAYEPGAEDELREPPAPEQTSSNLEDALSAASAVGRSSSSTNDDPHRGQSQSAEPESGAVPPPPPQEFVPVFARPVAEHNVEMLLGTKWLNWIGALFIMMFVAYGLKYSYDNAWIGPKGRLAIGTFFGVAALAIGEHFRRKTWGVLFQTLTGIGIATFYACVFFSFQVYHLATPGTAFVLATGVTALAVFLAVLHNSVSIAILGVIGGFLSPVLISTGENHPYILFGYILTLDLVAMAAAYFRRWHALDLLCFAGTVVMLTGWHLKFGHLPGQDAPALLFTSIFYLVFLVVPMLHTFVRKLPGDRQATVLTVGNALFSASMYYRLLYPENSHVLGFVILAQAALMFLLFGVWVRRVGSANLTAHSLLVIALCLVVASVPLHLSRYGLAIVWALQGALFTYFGIRYVSQWTRGIGLAALGLAALILLKNLPLHRAEFTPVLNAPFLSWMLVASAAFVSAWLTWKRSPPEDENSQPFSIIAFLLGSGLLWLLPAFEISSYWRFNYTGQYRDSYTMSSVLVAWSVMSAALVTALRRREGIHEGWHLLTGMAFVVTAMVFLSSLTDYHSPSEYPFVNSAYLPRLVFVAALAWAARMYGYFQREGWLQSFEGLAHFSAAVLVALEMARWGKANEAISDRIAFSLVSLAWALHAFGLILAGLRTRRRYRRILGFLLFGIVVFKVLIVDTSELEKVYRILSFGGTGLLLLAAGYFFQKYSAALLREEGSPPEQAGG